MALCHVICFTSLAIVIAQDFLQKTVKEIDNSSVNFVSVEPGIKLAPQAANWLGRGHDLASVDYWNSPTIGNNLFAAAIPGSCFVEVLACNMADSKTKYFDSVSNWANEYSTSFGLGASIPLSGIYASIKGSLGLRGSDSVQTSRHIAYTYKVDRRSCFRLEKGNRCASNVSYLQPDFIERLHLLNQSTGSPYTKENMDRWNVLFLTRFGTHVTMESHHGAKAQGLVSADSRSVASNSCVDLELCLGVNWLNATDANACPKYSSCDNASQWTRDFSTSCSALGGDPDVRHEICHGKPSSETLKKWIDGADHQSGSSVISTVFEPLNTFVINLNPAYFQHAKTIEKAIEFRNCRLEDGERWEAGDDGELGCRCKLTCRNGGSLDSDSCTCKCPGNSEHGWSGLDCSEFYDKCQPGEIEPLCNVRDCAVVDNGEWRNSAWRQPEEAKCKCPKGFVVTGDLPECIRYHGIRYFSPKLTPFACQCERE